ncbi:hypothetical protein Tco_1221781 [Tanacetum coccineum]
MNPLVVEQRALDDALVAPENCVVIGKCNMRIEPTKTQKEATYQVVLDTLKLSPCYKALLVTADVPKIYMHQFWFTISKIKDSSSYQFKLDKKKFRIGVEVFHEVLQIFLRIPNQEFVEPPSHEDIVTFIKEIGYRGELEPITELYIDHMSQPWRTFASIIKKCLSRKTTDFMYQIDNRQSTDARRSSMPNPKFTNAIIQHFISKDKTISMRNNLFMHGIKNESVLGVLKLAYKTYLAFATGNAIPKKAKKRTTTHITPIKESSLTVDDNIILINRTEAKEHEATRLVHETQRLVTGKPTRRRKETGVIFRDTPIVSTKKTPPQSLKLKGREMLSDAAMLAADIRKSIKTSKRDLKSQHQSSSSSEGAGITPEGSEEDEVVLTSEDERTNSYDDKSIDLNKTDNEEETQGDDFVHTPDDYVPTDDETHDVDDKEYIRINEELYDDVNVEMKDVEHADEGKGDEEMTDVEMLRVSDLKKEVKELKQVDLSTTLHASIRSEVPPAVNEYLGSSLGDALQNEL